MKNFLRNVSPLRATKDLWQVLGAPSEFRGRSLLMAVVVTGALLKPPSKTVTVTTRLVGSGSSAAFS